MQGCTVDACILARKFNFHTPQALGPTYGSFVAASSIRRIQVFPDRGTVANTTRLRTCGDPATHLQPVQFDGILQAGQGTVTKEGLRRLVRT